MRGWLKAYARTRLRAVPAPSRLTSLARSPISSQNRRRPATGTLRCQEDSRRKRRAARLTRSAGPAVAIADAAGHFANPGDENRNSPLSPGGGVTGVKAVWVAGPG